MSPGRTAALSALAVGVVVGAWLFLRRDDAAPRAVESKDAASPQAAGPRLAAAPRGATRAPEPSPAGGAGPWRLVGTVRSAGGGAVIGARVHVSLQQGDVMEEIVRATARAPDGAYDADLGPIATRGGIERASGHLFVRATAAHHRPGEGRTVDLPPAGATAPLVANLLLEPGAAVRGRVIRAGGPPVAGASVLLTTGGTHAGWSRTDAEGRYEIGVARGGTSRVVATASSIGAGSLPLLLDVDEDTDAPDLLVRGPGSIDGTVRYADGSPVGATLVHARPDDGSGEGGAYDEADAQDPNEGLARTIAPSDASGRFHLAGLKPGRYVVWTRASTGAALDTGETNAMLVVALRRLRIRIRDADGRPLPGSGYVVRWDGGRGEETSAGGVDAEGAVDFWEKPGTRFFVAAYAQDVRAEAVAVLDERRNETEVTLTLAPDSRPKGWVRLSVNDPSGDPIPHVETSLYTDVAGAVVTYKDAPDEGGRMRPVTPGRYRLEVTPGRETGAAPIETYFPIEAAVEVKPGAETAVALTARRGGRVRLTLRGSGKERPPERGIEVTAQSRAGGPSIRLGAFVTVVDGKGYTISGLRPGEPGISLTLLEPGPHEVRVTAPGWKEGRATVSLDPGQIGDAEIVLQRE